MQWEAKVVWEVMAKAGVLVVKEGMEEEVEREEQEGD